MFQVYSIAGRVFSGSLEQLRQVASTSAVARVRRIAPVGSEPLEPRAASDVPTPPSATGAARSGVLAAYAAAAQSGQTRKPLTRVADVMSRHVQTVPLEASVLQATPARKLFATPERAFSSGCIRVERVFELAELLMGDAQRWNQAFFATIVATGRTRVVPLPSPVVVILMYWTVDVTADGGVVFKRDIYGRDLPLLQALNVPFKSRAQSPAR